MKREKVSLFDNGMDVLIKMSEGNPGGLSILAELSKKERGVNIFHGLDDMNIRGWQIWCGYKDYCKSNLDTFIDAIKKRDSDMVDKINEQAIRDQSPERAVTSGASFNR